MLSSVQMVILVVTVIFSGALCAVLLNLLNNHLKKNMNFYCEDFSNHVTYKRMRNADVDLDDIIYNFKLII